MKTYGSEDSRLGTLKLRAEGARSWALEYWHSRAQRYLRHHLISLFQGHKLKCLPRLDGWGKVRSKATEMRQKHLAPLMPSVNSLALVIICFLNYMGTKAQGAEDTCPRSQSKDQEDCLDLTLSAMIGKQVPGSQLCQLPFSPWHCSSHPLCTSSINSHPWKKKKHLPPKTLPPSSTPVPQTIPKLITFP